ncbi:MAG: peptidylprolyl isomerase [Acidobacteriota bacterium]
MKSVIPLLIFGLAAIAAVAEEVADAPATTNPQVVLETSLGNIVLELDAERAPKSTANFLGYVDSGHYDGTIFHRVIRSFMVQGGGFTPDLKQKKTGEPVPNEADNGLDNVRGSIAMARTMDPNSATAQFFINTVDNAALDHRSKDVRGWGYAVFGRVVEGMEVVDAIEGVKTGTRARYRDVPVEDVVIKAAKRVAAPAE